MLKEVVDFSKKLEENGIYELIQKENQKIDKPIFVIPVNNDMTEIEIDKSYFVFKDIAEKDGKLILTLDGKRNKENTDYNSKEYKLELNDDLKNLISQLCNEPKLFQKVLQNIDNYSQKPSNDKKGNKSIGSNKGTNSYTILIFNINYQTLMKNKETFFKKISNTYKENFKKGLPINFDENELNSFTKLFSQLSMDSNLQVFWTKLNEFRKNTFVKDKDMFDSVYCILKFPNDLIENSNIYKSWYEDYLSKKLFKTDPPKKDKGYPVRNCAICNDKSETWLPNAFHNLDSKKPFTLHLDRKTDHNLAVCYNCSMKIYKFQELFLNKKKISVFPLFITDEFVRKEIILLKTDLTKVSFSDVIKEVTLETPNDMFDFFLIIYNRDIGLLNFDYISGFILDYNGKSIFEIEQQLNELFFEYKLQHNYFSKKVDTKNANLDNLIYRYRTQIFDFVYRAKDSINSNDISNMYYHTLQRRLRDCYNREKEALATANLNKLKIQFLELDKTLGGYFMQTVERIKESGKVTDLESLSYYIGQIVYYLLNQSKKGQKTHAMVEPFINVANFRILGIKLEETFNAYKHELTLNWDKLNQMFSQIWSFLYDNQDQEFNRDLKILFYAGYFDKNIFFQTTKK
ncbi:MAG: hypothetical protein JW866_11020 [Ignavibacteriales bacterium]|nr:hypothetical protein [Ignavibacteriales bacterium]